VIYSRQLYTEEQPRREYPAGLRTHSKPPLATPKPSAKIHKTITTPFGSIYSTVKLIAHDVETGKIVGEKEFSVAVYETNRGIMYQKEAELLKQLNAEGYVV